MKRQSPLLFASFVILFSSIIFSMVSCNLFSSKQSFAAKNDSLDFANKVLAAYPQDREQVFAKYPRKGLKVKFETVNSFAKSNIMEPINWKTVTDFADNYDKDPLLLKPDSTPYKGFKIDKSGFALLKANPNFDEVYLRLGKNYFGEFTFMILPMSKGGLRQNKPRQSIPNTKGGLVDPNENYDHLDPCPDGCPTNFDNRKK